MKIKEQREGCVKKNLHSEKKMTLEELFKYKFGFGKNEFVDVVDIRTQKISD